MIHKSGFTLIEAMLTLFIFSGLIAVGTFQVKDYQRQTEEKLALKKFEAKWNQILITSYLEKIDCQVHLKTKSVQFKYGKQVESFELPGTLVNQSKNDINIKADGTTVPLSIRFYTDGRNVKHFYTVQMNWGVLVAKNP